MLLNNKKAAPLKERLYVKLQFDTKLSLTDPVALTVLRRLLCAFMAASSMHYTLQFIASIIRRAESSFFALDVRFDFAGDYQ